MNFRGNRRRPREKMIIMMTTKTMGDRFPPFLLPSFLPSAHDHPFISLILPPRETKWGDFENGNGFPPPRERSGIGVLEKKTLALISCKTSAAIRSRPSMQNCEESGKKEGCQKRGYIAEFLSLAPVLATAGKKMQHSSWNTKRPWGKKSSRMRRSVNTD